MKNDQIIPVVMGFGIFLLVLTAPFWLPRLLGIDPKRCECGIQLTSDRILPYCKCEY